MDQHLFPQERTVMHKDTGHHHSQLFTLRIWPEHLSDDLVEWRGRVQHVSSGETYYFRDWSTLVTLLLAMLSKAEGNGGSAGP
jgi:hypothetical protein